VSDPALRVISVSWPRPIECDEQRWTSDPEWDAPPFAQPPPWHEREVGGATSLAIDWREAFAGIVRGARGGGEMKQFHVVFRLRVERNGTLVFHDDDGSIIRRDGQIVHEDREVHPMTRHELRVRAGDALEVAHFQYHGAWQWAGRIEPQPPSLEDDAALFAPFREHAAAALRAPNGPALKMYVNAAHPVRTALAAYSAILNGYRPEGLLLFGEDQWSAEQRRAMETLLPFAEIVARDDVLQSVRALQPEIIPTALRCWAAMKLCVCLLHPPFEYGYVDDDVIVLDKMDEALRRFKKHDVVYAPDADYEQLYRSMWAWHHAPLPTRHINTGVHFLRNTKDRGAQAARMATSSPDGTPVGLWEQGFFATEFADDRTWCLPTQTYFYPLFDGLPGGFHGYDWGGNPCGFVTVHFGGLRDKPSDDDVRPLVPEVLGRHRARARARRRK
jgi:hypothetical protein